MRFDLNDERVRDVIARRDAEIERLLREAGPGKAVGFRMALPNAVLPEFATVETITWEFYVLDVVDGEIPEGPAGFQYVTLKKDV